MKAFWIIALAGFVAVSFFGLLSIHHQGDHIAECLASRLNGSDAPCPAADPFGFANFHNDALKKISTLIPIDVASIAYLALIAGLLFFGLFAVPLADKNLILVSILEYSSLTGINPVQARKLAWFSIHENSPSFFKG
ncbi:MAG: hypothetical protein Q7S43_04985 [bacterium]|nr:hypothetical protein [bacterium]